MDVGADGVHEPAADGAREHADEPHRRIAQRVGQTPARAHQRDVIGKPQSGREATPATLVCL